MKQLKLFWALLFCMMISNLFAQQQVVLTFKGENQTGDYVQLSKVVLFDITHGWSDTLIYPDTMAILMIENDNISENDVPPLGLFQNTPNPFHHGTTQVKIAVAESGPLSLEVMDINGRLIVAQNFTLMDRGTHQFSIHLSTPQMYLLTARQNGNVSSIKMLNKGNSGIDKIEYEGVALDDNLEIKTKNTVKGIINHQFSYGDSMIYKGYATIDNEEIESDIVVQTQTTSEAITLIFDMRVLEDGLPCPGITTLTDIDGNTYTTVKIGSQCWMKENLRTTKYANGTTILQGTYTSTSVANWYYPDEDSVNINRYGLLYNWKAVTQGISSTNNPSGVQGICPQGWHVPSDAEWTQLTDYVSSKSQYVCDNNTTYIAKALADTTGWATLTINCVVGNTQSTNNATGFSALPAGYFNGLFYIFFGDRAFYWTATQLNISNAYYRSLDYTDATVNRNYYTKHNGFSVRCVCD